MGRKHRRGRKNKFSVSVKRASLFMRFLCAVATSLLYFGLSHTETYTIGTALALGQAVFWIDWLLE